MLPKRLFVADQLQQALFIEIISKEFRDGFWREHRPRDHYEYWEGVDIVVTENGMVGASAFKTPCGYNFTNPEFLDSKGEHLLTIARKFKPTMSLKSLKEVLTQMSRIVSGRLHDLSLPPQKAFRGTNLPDEADNIRVLSSGKGLGGEKWLSAVQQLNDKIQMIGYKATEQRSQMEYERGSKKLRLYLNGADELVLETVDGVVIHFIKTSEDISSMTEYAVIKMASPYSTAKQERSNVTPKTMVVGDNVIRRMPVSRPKIVAPAFTAANPFGLIAG